jgi:hypothetical protein
MSSHVLRRALALWLPVAAAGSVLAFALYGGVQQAQRSAADDPQLQMARDAAAALSAGAAPRQVAAGPPVDIRTSLAPWIAVFDADGNPLAATGSIDGKPPVVPDQARADAANGERTFTWEPEAGLRMATVVEPFSDGTVVTARSMREVEIRENRTLAIAAGAWILALLAGAGAALLGAWAWGSATRD